MTPAPKSLVEPRRPLTRREIIELAVRQAGRCGCGCGEKLDALTEGVIDEHVIPLELLGSNDLKNRELWRKPCSDAKTKKDRTSIAKAQRLAGETCGAPTKHPIKSRGFGHLTRKFDGSIGPSKAEQRRLSGRALGREDGRLTGSRDEPKSPSPPTTWASGRGER